nr:protein phosphatase 1 regulatory subunit 3G [Anas platyrhynchos]
MASPLQPQQELTAPGEQRLLWGSGAAGAKRQPSGERAEGLLLLELRRCPRPPAPGAEREEEEDEEDEEEEDEEEEEEEAAAGPGCCPKCKKRVQFADSLGLSLASVKHFSDAEEPRVPPAALSRLQSPHVEPKEPGAAPGLPCGGALLLEPDFPDGGAPSAERLRRQRVCLERLCPPASAAGVRGTVQVLPSGGPAEVTVRYTFNEWLSFMDAPAEPLPPAATTTGTTGTTNPAVEAPAERYGFTLCVPPSPGEGSALHFAVRYRSQQGEYWDNNQGRNYTLRWCRRHPDGGPGTDGTGREGGT